MITVVATIIFWVIVGWLIALLWPVWVWLAKVFAIMLGITGLFILVSLPFYLLFS